MSEFKVGDRVRVIGPSNIGLSETGVNVLGNVLDIIRVDHDDENATYLASPNGKYDCSLWFPRNSLERVETSDLTITVTSELTHITIGGKRFRLVAED